MPIIVEEMSRRAVLDAGGHAAETLRARMVRLDTGEVRTLYEHVNWPCEDLIGRNVAASDGGENEALELE